MNLLLSYEESIVLLRAIKSDIYALQRAVKCIEKADVSAESLLDDIKLLQGIRGRFKDKRNIGYREDGRAANESDKGAKD
jgi:hypothetical protein